MNPLSLLADLLLVIHFAFVVFVVGGLAVIWLGWFRRWEFVRNVCFRVGHLVAIGVVLAESLGGVVCPLTTWEARLRAAAGAGETYHGSFVQHWVHRLMFFEAEEWVFTAAYTLFFAAVVLSWLVVKPRWIRARRFSPFRDPPLK